jgi:acetyl-CoA carboxylase beta subunit
MRPRINPNHVGSSVYRSEVAINQRRYKDSLKHENVESTNRIVDILDEKTFKMFESMKGVVWQHTYCGHTIQITPMEASRLLSNGIKGITVTL